MAHISLRSLDFGVEFMGTLVRAFFPLIFLDLFAAVHRVVVCIQEFLTIVELGVPSAQSQRGLYRCSARPRCRLPSPTRSAN